MAAGGLSAVVAGAGLMGRWHAYEIGRAGGDVVAVADRDLPSARRLARRHRDARAFGSLEEAVAAVAADVVHVCTPTGTHAELVGRALDAGLPALVEKPLAPDGPATREILERARDAGRLLCPVHQFLFQRGARRLFDRAEALGPVRHVDFTACSAGAEGGADPRSVAREILPHPLSFLERLAPGGLDGLDLDAVEPAPGELRATAHAAGFSASVLVSMSGRPTENRMRVVGEGGTARLNLYHGYAVLAPAGRPTRLRKAAAPFLAAGREGASAGWNLLLRAASARPAYPGLRELVRRFHAAIAEGAPPPIDPRETLAVAEARDAIEGLLEG